MDTDIRYIRSKVMRQEIKFYKDCLKVIVNVNIFNSEMSFFLFYIVSCVHIKKPYAMIPARRYQYR